MPFNLTESKKKVVQVAQSNPSMAEGVQNWQKKTPERFHSSRHGEVYRMVEVMLPFLNMIIFLTSNHFSTFHRELRCAQQKRTHRSLWLPNAIAQFTL